jgi:hypothetical protein
MIWSAPFRGRLRFPTMRAVGFYLAVLSVAIAIREPGFWILGTTVTALVVVTFLHAKASGSFDGAADWLAGTAAILGTLSFALTFTEKTFTIVFFDCDAGALLMAAWFCFFSESFAAAETRQPPLRDAALVSLCAAAIMFAGLTTKAVFDVGLLDLIRHSDTLVERLRDVTFPIWDNEPFGTHLGLTFHSKEDFAARRAYTSHGFLFLLEAYTYYKLLFQEFGISLRTLMVANMMLLAVGASATIGIYLFTHLRHTSERILVLLGAGFALTSPAIWIIAGKYNIDNPFVLMFALLVPLSFLISLQPSKHWRWSVALALGTAATSPVTACFVGFFWLLAAFSTELRYRPVLVKLGLIITGASVVCYVAPLLLAKLGGMSTIASSWLFRSGLDGDTTYFLNPLQAILTPVWSRPLVLIAAPFMVLAIQELAIWKTGARSESKGARDLPNGVLLYGTLSAPYASAVLFWPQAVSIHPYLFDLCGLMPIYVAILMNFRYQRAYRVAWIAWAAILALAIQSNLTLVSQAARLSQSDPCGAGVCGPDVPTSCSFGANTGFGDCRF